MWWGQPIWGGLGMPFGMFLFPAFFLVCIGLMLYLFNRGGLPFSCHGGGQVQSDVTNRELLEEVRKLRQEVEDLKKKKQ